MKNKLLGINIYLLLISLLAILTVIVSIFLIRKSTEEQFGCDVIDDNEPTVIQIDSSNTEVIRGQAVFSENCKTCHAVHTQEVGPELYRILYRRSEKWAKQYIRNSQVLLSKKDTAAINLAKQYSDIKYPHQFENLTDGDLDALFMFIDAECHYGSHLK
ncbi:MAG: hypothetical protein JWO58_1087 [Chitinophagaceae bacterium]|nr:hypothetical protein [Chitinophagaceae bacterium]